MNNQNLIKSAKAVISEEYLSEAGFSQISSLASDNPDSKKVGSMLEKSISSRDRLISMAAQEWAKAIFVGELYGWTLDQDRASADGGENPRGTFKEFINSKKWDRNSLKKDREFQDALEWVKDDLIKEVSKNLAKIKI